MVDSQGGDFELEDYVKSIDSVQEGHIIKGVILEVDEKNGNVFVDINYKSEGILSLNEFSEAPQKGQEIEVLLIRREGRDGGSAQVSKLKADEIRFKRNLKNNMQVGQVIEGTIKSQVKGGFIVSLSHKVEAFLPASKVDLHAQSDPSIYIGQKSLFLVSQFKFERGNCNIVLDRKTYLKREASLKKDAFLKSHEEGDIVEGYVKEFISFGAFIDLGGFDGLLHLNDMSWGHSSRPKDFVEKGQKLTLKIIHLDSETGRINLSLKELQDDPWKHLGESIKVGDILEGFVTKLTSFGAFVQIKEGIEGLVHISEFSWTKKVEDPKEVVSVGQKLKCVVLEMHLEKRRVALGVKQLEGNPWDKIESHISVGDELDLEVVKILPAAALLKVEEGLDAYLSIADISWTTHYQEMKECLKIGEKTKVKVLQITPQERKMRVGIKQLTDNPWESFKLRGVVEATLVQKGESFWKASLGEIEAIIPKSRVAISAYGSFEDADKSLSVGDKVYAIIQKVDSRKREIVLSLKDYFKDKEKGEISQYLSKESEDETSGYNPFSLLKK